MSHACTDIHTSCDRCPRQEKQPAGHTVCLEQQAADINQVSAKHACKQPEQQQCNLQDVTYPHRLSAYLGRCSADVLQTRLVHGRRQNDVAVVAHDMSLRVVQFKGLCSGVLILNGPLADGSTSLLEAL